jgi:demethylmenaquinone methyltransferase / 2-methoxy-6-polyprenyl-1,4-benzoquinol methylase
LRIASSHTDLARSLFAGIAPEYDRMGRVMSFGQDGRWRRFLVSRIAPPEGGRVLDVATGTGLVAREIARRSAARIVGIDLSPEMLHGARAAIRRERLEARVAFCLGQAERLPFGDGAFDAVTFTYLLRYVEDPAATVAELTRVLKPGGVLAGLEFGVPSRRWSRAAWRGYTQRALPLIGRAQSREWADTGRFLGPSISAFYEDHPLDEQLATWRRAGVPGVRSRSMSFGVGVVTWGTRE